MRDASTFRRHNPLITDEGFALLKRLRDHTDAPRWNEVIGDHILAEDIAAVDRFRTRLQKPWPAGARMGQDDAPPPEIIEWVEKMRPRSPIFEAHIPCGTKLARDWAYIPTMSRRDLATRLVDITPTDADLARLIVYDTTGTTGHAVNVPHHPRALALSHALGEYAMATYGARPAVNPGEVMCFNVGAQVNTYVFPAIFSVWNQGGFAKLNLHPNDWPAGADGGLDAAIAQARRYFDAFRPQFISADPVGIAEMLRWDVGHGVGAIFSTAVELSPGLKARAEAHYGCPVIDWYSTTETGPIAFSAPDGAGLKIAAPDIWVEALDPAGLPVPPDQMGELTVTGGRNPYAPLLRYRTGDFGRVENGRIYDLHGRKMVFFRATDGAVVNPVDIGRIMRLHCAFAQHQFVQNPDGACLVRVRPVPGLPVDATGLSQKLATLFGPNHPIEICVDPTLGNGNPGGKVEPYVQHREESKQQ